MSSSFSPPSMKGQTRKTRSSWTPTWTMALTRGWRISLSFSTWSATTCRLRTFLRGTVLMAYQPSSSRDLALAVWPMLPLPRMSVSTNGGMTSWRAAPRRAMSAWKRVRTLARRGTRSGRAAACRGTAPEQPGRLASSGPSSSTSARLWMISSQVSADVLIFDDASHAENRDYPLSLL